MAPVSFQPPTHRPRARFELGLCSDRKRSVAGVKGCEGSKLHKLPIKRTRACDSDSAPKRRRCASPSVAGSIRNILSNSWPIEPRSRSTMPQCCWLVRVGRGPIVERWSIFWPTTGSIAQAQSSSSTPSTGANSGHTVGCVACPDPRTEKRRNLQSIPLGQPSRTLQFWIDTVLQDRSPASGRRMPHMKLRQPKPATLVHSCGTI